MSLSSDFGFAPMTGGGGGGVSAPGSNMNQLGQLTLTQQGDQKLAQMNNQSAQQIAAGNNATQLGLGQLQAGLGYYQTDKNAATQMGLGQLQASTDIQKQQMASQSANYASQNQLYGTKYASDQQLASSRVQAQASTLPARLQQQRFNTVFPYLQNFMGQQAGLTQSLGAGQSGGYGSTAGEPAIDASPVYSRGQINQQVNQGTAGIQAQTAGNIKQANDSLAGRGFSSNSPLSQSLAAMYQGQGLQAATQNATNTRMQAAQQNQQAVFGGQVAQENQYANRQNEANQRLGILMQPYNTLLGSLGGII